MASVVKALFAPYSAEEEAITEAIIEAQHRRWEEMRQVALARQEERMKRRLALEQEHREQARPERRHVEQERPEQGGNILLALTAHMAAMLQMICSPGEAPHREATKEAQPQRQGLGTVQVDLSALESECNEENATRQHIGRDESLEPLYSEEAQLQRWEQMCQRALPSREDLHTEIQRLAQASFKQARSEQEYVERESAEQERRQAEEEPQLQAELARREEVQKGEEDTQEEQERRATAAAFSTALLFWKEAERRAAEGLQRSEA